MRPPTGRRRMNERERRTGGANGQRTLNKTPLLQIPINCHIAMQTQTPAKAAVAFRWVSGIYNIQCQQCLCTLNATALGSADAVPSSRTKRQRAHRRYRLYCRNGNGERTNYDCCFAKSKGFMLLGHCTLWFFGNLNTVHEIRLEQCNALAMHSFRKYQHADAACRNTDGWFLQAFCSICS